MRILLLFGLLFSSVVAYSQYTHGCDTVYQFVKEMPKYRGSDDPSVLLKDIYKIAFGKACQRDEMGKVYWTIDADGHIIDIVAREARNTCEEFIIAQFKQQLSDWTPGKINGEPVCVRMVVLMEPGH